VGHQTVRPHGVLEPFLTSDPLSASSEAWAATSIVKDINMGFSVWGIVGVLVVTRRWHQRR